LSSPAFSVFFYRWICCGWHGFRGSAGSIGVGEIAFRYAVAADVEAIHALVERVYRGPEARAGWTSEADLLSQPRTSLAEVAGLIADGDHRFVLGELLPMLLGFYANWAGRQ
jgi:hypothetical protein